MTLVNDLKKICKEVKGNVITIGLENKTVVSELDKNDKICNLYSMQFNGKKRSKKTGRGSTGKTISIKKIRRVFKKKNIDYIICNIGDIEYFLRTFIRDSIYINKIKIYIYGTTDNVDIELLEKRYKRYKVEINILEYTHDFLMEIDTTNAYNHFFKDFFYNIVDIIVLIYNTIGDLLIS